MPRSYTPRFAMLALLLPAWAGCGGKEEAEASAGDAGARAAPAGPRVSVGELPALFQNRLPTPTPWLADNQARRDPAVDGWPSEVQHELASGALARLLDALRADDRAAEAAIWAPGAERASRTSLLPGALEVVRESHGVRARRAAPAHVEGQEEPRDLHAQWAELAAFFGAETPTATFEVVRVERDASEVFATQALIQLAAEVEGERRQQDFCWRLEWRAARGPDGAERAELVALERLAYADVALPAQPLADVSAAVFADLPAFESELVRGMESYLMAWDRLFGSEYLGMHGAALGDVDDDGLEDLYVCQLGGLPNRLYVRRPDGSLEDRSSASWLNILDNTRSALILDFDGDRVRDVALAIDDAVLVCYGAGGGVFPQESEHRVWLRCPTPEGIYSISAADPDRDGDLDIYAARYVQGGIAAGFPTPYHDARNGASNHFFQNTGQRGWNDATEALGLGQNNDRFSLASIWEDFDDDGDLDLYVTNDFGRNNYYQNDGSGHFVDVADQIGAHDQASGMGASAADFDLDGDMDVYVTNMFSAAGLRIASQPERYMGGANPELHRHYQLHARGNTLLANDGSGHFTDATEQAGVALGRWAWGAMFFELDNDGFEDLYVPNGFVTNTGREDLDSFFWRRVTGQSPASSTPSQAYEQAWTSISYMVQFQRASWNARERNCVYLNRGDGTFSDVSAASGADFSEDGRAVLVCDWDDDGRQDLLLRSRNAPRLRLLQNQSPPAHFLSIELEDPGPNGDAIGAKIFVEAGGRTQRRTLHAGDGYLAQSSLRASFGLGTATVAERVAVVWPDGARETFEDLAADRHLRIVRGAGAPVAREPLARAALARERPGGLAARPETSQRIVLGDKLPLGPLPLPSFADSKRRASALGGSAAIVVLWSSECAPCEAELAELAARRSEFAAAGIALAPISTDAPGAGLARARARMRELGLDAAGYADGATLRQLEAVFLEVLGNFDRVPLPASLVLDRAGQLVALHLGTPGAEALLADARVVAEMAPSYRFTGRLSDGRWLMRRGRDFAELARVFEAIGNPELAALYRQQVAE